MKSGFWMLAALCLTCATIGYGQRQMPMPGGRMAPPADDPNITKLDPNTVLVSYGSDKLTLGQAKQFLPSLTADSVKNIANQWLELQLLYADAKKKGLTEDPKSKMMAELSYKQPFARAVMEKVAAEANVPDSQVSEYYEKNKNTDPMLSEPNRYSFTHIKVKTAAEANDLLAKIRGGGDIAELAKQFSTARDAKTGGVVNKLPERALTSQYDSDFVKAIEAAAEGQLIGPIKSQDGFEIARHEGKLSMKVKPFEEVKNTIKDRLVQEAKMNATKNYLEKLKEDAKGEIKKASLIDTK